MNFRHKLNKKYSTLLLFIVTSVVLSLLIWQLLYATVPPDPQLYSLSSPQKPSSPPSQPTITLVAVGDIMLSRDVEQKMLRSNDWIYPFKETHQITTLGDIVFGNLESPFIEGPIVPTNSMVFRADPRSIEGLHYGGFNVLSLANNHLKDYGDSGIESTITTLDQANIQHVGGGMNSTEARTAALVTIQDITFGILAYVDDSFTPASYEATDDRSGAAFMTEDALRDDISQLSSQADVIVVSMHAGYEYTEQPNAKQINFAHAAIESGAQLVIGHHPHVVQPIEQYNNGYIIYSLGNFVFDQMWSEATRESAIATITFIGTEIEQIDLTPIKIFDYCQPRVLENEDGDHILQRMSHLQ